MRHSRAQQRTQQFRNNITTLNRTLEAPNQQQRQQLTLQYEEVIAGIGYNTGSRNKIGTIGAVEVSEEEQGGEEYDSDMEQSERGRVELEAQQWHVPQLGNMKEGIPDGVFRLMGRQLNSAATRAVRDKKIADIHQIIDQWDVQGGGFLEVGINWQRLPHARGFSAWFRSHPDDFLTSTTHNMNENVNSMCQQGRIALFAGKELRQYIKLSSEDSRRLGR